MTLFNDLRLITDMYCQLQIRANFSTVKSEFCFNDFENRLFALHYT
jgi:hypothetical protein